MPISTPTFDYGRATNDLATSTGRADVAQDYGRFLSQERFRRGRRDLGRTFERGFPGVSSSFNRRGLYNSGLRREGQRDYADQYQRALDATNLDELQTEIGFDQAAADRQVSYQRALLDLYEQLQAGRAAGTQIAPISGQVAKRQGSDAAPLNEFIRR